MYVKILNLDLQPDSVGHVILGDGLGVPPMVPVSINYCDDLRVGYAKLAKTSEGVFAELFLKPGMLEASLDLTPGMGGRMEVWHDQDGATYVERSRLDMVGLSHGKNCDSRILTLREQAKRTLAVVAPRRFVV